MIARATSGKNSVFWNNSLSDICQDLTLVSFGDSEWKMSKCLHRDIYAIFYAKVKINTEFLMEINTTNGMVNLYSEENGIDVIQIVSGEKLFLWECCCWQSIDSILRFENIWPVAEKICKITLSML